MGKKEVLQGNGTYNKNHGKVKDVRFVGNAFYGPMDIVQVKYEMIKDVVREEKTVTDAATDFGFSRTAFYAIIKAFDKQGVSGLLPEKPGPRKPHKLTPECQKQIYDYIADKPRVSSAEIAAAVSVKGGVSVSKRTIERYRAKKTELTTVGSTWLSIPIQNMSTTRCSGVRRCRARNTFARGLTKSITLLMQVYIHTVGYLSLC